MTRPRSIQAWLHWLEIGAGAQGIRIAAVLLGTVALSLLVAWKQFRGPGTEWVLQQADVGRQLAAGAGFTTLVNYPQTAAVLASRGGRFDPAEPYPDLHHAPLYPALIGGALRLLPERWREGLFNSAPVPPDGFAADYFLLGLNLVLFWVAAWLTFSLGRAVFDPRVGGLAAAALLLSAPSWQQTVAVNGTPLLMVLALLTFHAWWKVEQGLALENRGGWFRFAGWLAIGAGCGLLFLAEYAAGVLVAVALVYACWRPLTGRALAFGLVAGGFLLVAGPWILRNVLLAGHPLALAAQDLALRAGDSTAEPDAFRAAWSASAPPLDLFKLGNKTLTALQAAATSGFWSGGALWFGAFFVAGWLYPFRSAAANRLRWVFTGALATLLLGQAALSSGEGERAVTAWCAPLLLVFGAAFFFVLLGSNARLGQWPRTVAIGLLTLQTLPLLQDVLEPRRLHFRYPPYFPALFHGLREDLERRGAAERFGLMADVPAGVAWYGRCRAWAQPTRLKDFHTVAVIQPVGHLLLTPRTLDRPFFSELNARPMLPAALEPATPRFGDWGEVYAGLLTGALPRDFPLGASQKLADNLYVLSNPTLPAPRGK